MTQAKDQAKNPWDYMGAEERRILGDIVANPEEQAQIGRASCRERV